MIGRKMKYIKKKLKWTSIFDHTGGGGGVN